MLSPFLCLPPRRKLPPPDNFNLHISQDVPALIHYPARPSPRTDPPHHLSTYRLATLLSLPLLLSLLLFWALSHRNPSLVIYYDFLPISYLCFLLAVFLLPLRRFSSAGRTRFLATLRRVSIGGIALAYDGKFGDILLADVLTSYAKIIADLFVALCMFFSPNGSATKRPDRGCGGQYIVPIVIAIPSLIRFRQCVTEYLRARASSSTSTSSAALGHLANALKYFSAFPVILLSALQRNLSVNHAHVGLSEAGVYRAWVAAVVVNSFYSFYWDVARDWDLTLFSALSSSASSAAAHKRNPAAHSPSSSSSLTVYPFGLRPRLYFPSKEIYYVAIVADLLLRMYVSSPSTSPIPHYFHSPPFPFFLSLPPPPSFSFKAQKRC